VTLIKSYPCTTPARTCEFSNNLSLTSFVDLPPDDEEDPLWSMSLFELACCANMADVGQETSTRETTTNTWTRVDNGQARVENLESTNALSTDINLMTERYHRSAPPQRSFTNDVPLWWWSFLWGMGREGKWMWRHKLLSQASFTPI